MSAGNFSDATGHREGGAPVPGRGFRRARRKPRLTFSTALFTRGVKLLAIGRTQKVVAGDLRIQPDRLSALVNGRIPVLQGEACKLLLHLRAAAGRVTLERDAVELWTSAEELGADILTRLEGAGKAAFAATLRRDWESELSYFAQRFPARYAALTRPRAGPPTAA
jgi:hypothetical protein